jgi:hypothetical protein
LKNNLHFSRFEFKYILPLNLRKRIEAELSYFLQLDPYVIDIPSKKYMVRSLYFDDPSFQAYHDKIDGMLHRSKFRIRTYDNRTEANCATFLEIKGRHDALVFKHREEIVDYRDIPRGDSCEFHRIKKYLNFDSNLFKQFEYEYERKSIEPIMLIDYDRRPYVSKYDSEFRLTFDENIRATKTNSLYPNGFFQTKDILRGYTVMEVKFRYHVPSWFHRIIQAYSLRRVSVSKIVKGIDVWELAPYLDE